MSTALTQLTLAQARAGLVAGEFSAQALTQAYLDEIDAANAALNAYTHVTHAHALAQAAESDTRLKAGKARALEGIPLGIKDLFCTKDVATTAGSAMLKNFVPPYESTVTQNLWQAGAVLLGKLNMDEFAMGSSNETSHFGAVTNPWRRAGDDTPLVPGGSSGGAATAMAAHLACATLGSDTGGSIRQPAALTGTVGLKPSYGRCSRWGMIAFASSLDQAGPICHTIEDAALMLQVLASHDPADSTSADVPIADYAAGLGKAGARGNGLKGIRVGIPVAYKDMGLEGDVISLWQQAQAWCVEAGAQCVEVALPHSKYALPAYYILAPAEASSNLARYDGVRYGGRTDGNNLLELYEQTRAQLFGAEVKRRILTGVYVLSAGYYDAYYGKAQGLRRLICKDFDAAWAACDVLLTPTTPGPAFAQGEKLADPVAMYQNDMLTVPVNLAGLPAVSLPAGLAGNGLPLGLQLIAPAFEEARLLAAAHALEGLAQFKHRAETWWKT